MRGPLYLAAFLLLLSACRAPGGDRVLYEGSWQGRVPAPRGPVVLTVVTSEGTYPLDEAALKELTWVERKTVYHPEEKSGKVGVFEGVLLSTLLKELGEREPLRLRFEALDGYVIGVEWATIAPFDPLLALVQDGKPIPKEYGPVRIIFPYHRLKPDPVAYNAYWVWQLSRVIVEP